MSIENQCLRNVSKSATIPPTLAAKLLGKSEFQRVSGKLVAWSLGRWWHGIPSPSIWRTEAYLCSCSLRFGFGWVSLKLLGTATTTTTSTSSSSSSVCRAQYCIPRPYQLVIVLIEIPEWLCSVPWDMPWQCNPKHWYTRNKLKYCRAARYRCFQFEYGFGFRF